jgi:2-haloacid dehalogenase
MRGVSVQPRPRVIVFDVNETLSDMAPMAGRFADVGAPDLLATVWFASLLRDGFALAAAGGRETFARLARGALETVLAGASLNRPAAEAADHILAGFSDLSVHSDVPDGVRLLREGGLRLVTLSNGSADVAGRLLAKAGIRGEFEHLLSVEDADAWKPAPGAYAHAARVCSVPVGQMLLVAAHPWDIHGAHQAGMRTGWISRQPTPYPEYFSAPDLQAPDLSALARQVLS